MFTKNFRVTIESGFAMDLARILGKYGIKFEVTDEYYCDADSNRSWRRDFVIHTTKRKMVKIRKEYKNMKKIL